MSGFRAPVLVAWLTLVWVLLWGDITIQNLVAGVAIAIVAVMIARPTGTRFVGDVSFHPVAALWYGMFFAIQLVKSSLIVAWEVVTPGSSLQRAIVSVPMHTTSPGINTLVANTVTLTPGTITVDVRHRGGDALAPPRLYIHVLHFVDAESTRVEVLRLERYAVAAFGTSEQRAAVDAAVREFETADAGREVPS